jgi:hypothetical protein
MEKQIVNEPKEINGYRVVQDGKEIYESLSKGETVMHWESGNSMYPILMHMEYCKIHPAKKQEIKIGDAVFCKFLYRNEERKISDFYMVHRCTEVIERDEELYFRIDSTDGNCFGWTKDVYGIAESTGIFQDESVLLWN